MDLSKGYRRFLTDILLLHCVNAVGCINGEVFCIHMTLRDGIIAFPDYSILIDQRTWDIKISGRPEAIYQWGTATLSPYDENLDRKFSDVELMSIHMSIVQRVEYICNYRMYTVIKLRKTYKSWELYEQFVKGRTYKRSSIS